MKLVKESFWFKTKVREINGRYAIKIPKKLVKLNSLKEGDRLQQFLIKSNNKIICFGTFLDKRGLAPRTTVAS